MWVPREGPGLEHLRLTVHARTSRADGVIIGLDGDRAFRAHYALRCDASWGVREVRVALLGATTPSLHVRADGQGHWTDAHGRPLPALQGCIDVDLAATAFTNTLPIRRLALPPGASVEVAVVYIDVPALAVSAVRQRYDCLARGPDGGRYRYESLPGALLPDGFTDELLVDADGLVITYPQLFQRIWAT